MVVTARDIERHQRDQGDDHHAGHHLEAQLGVQQPLDQRPARDVRL